MPRSLAENSKKYFALNEALRSNLNKNKRIPKWQPFWNKVYCHANVYGSSLQLFGKSIKMSVGLPLVSKLGKSVS